jgi:hypothetical protein
MPMMMMTTTTVEPVAAVGRFLAAGVHACHRRPSPRHHPPLPVVVVIFARARVGTRVSVMHLLSFLPSE